MENRWLLYFHSIFGFVFLKKNGHKAYVRWWCHHCDVIKLAINLEQANSTHMASVLRRVCQRFLHACGGKAQGTTRSLCCGLGKARLEQLVPVCGRLLRHCWRWKARRRSLEEGLGASVDQKKSTGITRTRRHAQDQKRRRSSRVQTACTGVAGLILLGRAHIEGEMSSSPTWIAMAGNERGRWRACRAGSGQQFPCGVRQPWEGGWEHENGREFHLPISYCKAKTGDSLWTVPGQRTGTSVAVGWPRARRDLEGECRGELGLTAARRWETDARRVPLLHIGRADLEITSNLAKNGVGGDLFPSSRETWPRAHEAETTFVQNFFSFFITRNLR
jgi:hypothetical protein